MSTILCSLGNTDVNEAARAVLMWVGQGMLYGTVLALATWFVLRLLGRRIGPAVHGALWLIVLLRFVVPAGPASSWSLASLTRTLAQRWVHAAEATAPGQATCAEANSIGSLVVFDPIAQQNTHSSPTAAALRRSWPLATTVAGVYLLAVLVTAAVRLWRYGRLARRCRRLPTASDDVLGVVREVCARIGIRRVPDVRLSDDAPAPYIFGVLRPVLVLSRRQLARQSELETVVLHETAHLRRGDLVVRYLQWFVGTVLFFWPVVAWVNRRIDLMRECACDVWALRHGRLAPGEYARCLLRALQPVRSDGFTYCPAAMAGNVKSVERRIEMIMDTPVCFRSRRWLGVPAVALLAVWCGFALSGPSSAEEPKEEAKTESKSEMKVQVIVTKADADAEGKVDVDVEAIIEKLKLEGLKVDGEARVIVRKVQGDGIDGNVMVLVRESEAGEGVEGEGKYRVMELTTDGDDGETRKIIMSLNNQGGLAGKIAKSIKLQGGKLGITGGHMGHCFAMMHGKGLAEFAKDHPNADVDGDGKVSKIEHDAYLTALAMYAPDAVLEQFPKADRDESGTLEAMEAARLLSGPKIMMHHTTKPMVVTEGGEGKEYKIMVSGVGVDDLEEVYVGDVKIDVEVVKDEDLVVVKEKTVEVEGAKVDVRVVPAAEIHLGRIAEDGEAKAIVIKGGHGMPYMPAAWLLENINAEPTTYEVSQYLEVAEQAPLAALLERHPEADLDGDGVLSTQEHEAFTKETLKKLHLRIGKDMHGLGVEGKMLKFNVDELDPGTTVEEFIDEDGNKVKRLKVVKIEGGKVEVTVEETVEEPKDK